MPCSEGAVLWTLLSQGYVERPLDCCHQSQGQEISLSEVKSNVTLRGAVEDAA